MNAEVASKSWASGMHPMSRDSTSARLTTMTTNSNFIEANGDKVWEEDPSTCKSFEVTKCQQVPKPKTSVDYVAATISKPSKICCEVIRDRCEIKHSKEPQQQEITKYREVCDVPDDVIINRSSVEFGQ